MVQNKSRSLKMTLLCDWLMLVLIYVVIILMNRITPNEVQFALDDKRISKPHRGDTIKMVHLWGIVTLLCHVI